MKVHALTIWSAADCNSTLSLHTTQHGAKIHLAAFVREMWDEGLMDYELSKSDANNIADFFIAMEEDFQYEIQEKTVLGPEVAEVLPLGPDEVLLSPAEVQATIFALRSTKNRADSMRLSANLLKLGIESTSGLFRRVIEKLEE